jgi:hypothetical protein
MSCRDLSQWIAKVCVEGVSQEEERNKDGKGSRCKHCDSIFRPGGMRRSLSMKMKYTKSSKDYLSFDLRPQGAGTSPHSERGYLISVTGHVLARCRVVFSLA